MHIRVWGSRGSLPSPGPSTVRYGGNTSCVEVRLDDGTLIIVDAGSGIRALGAQQGTCTATLLLTHYHWDHIQGLPFFGPAYSPESDIRVIGPESNGEGPREYLDRQMSIPYFPAPPSQLRSIRHFEAVSDLSFAVGSALVTAKRVSHPGITMGYRIEEGGATFTYISDDEVELASPEVFADIVALASHADILFHDCQYTETEYAARHGWGHSTPRQAVRVAKEAGVQHLVLFHHDPAHNDDQVEVLAAEAQRLAGRLTVTAGREGDELAIDRKGTHDVRLAVGG